MAARATSQARLLKAYDRQAEKSLAADQRERLAQRQERAEKRAKADAQAPRDLDSLTPGSFVRDRWAWYTVVRVNKKSVTVETPYSWTKRIPFEKIIETRSLPEGNGE